MINVVISKHDDVVRFGDVELRILAERVIVPLGPFDNSDSIEVERDEETGEYRVLLQSPGNETECLFSCIEEKL